MKKLFKAIKRMWIIAFCEHKNMCCSTGTEPFDYMFCQKCGRLVKVYTVENGKDLNIR